MNASVEKENEEKRAWFKLKKPGKHMFWAWIIYQSIKGILTTSFIWIPLIYAMFFHGG
jgi:hypothetical protein